MSFINQTARQIWENHSDAVSEHLYLFPSRRSMLYFKKAIVEAAGKSLWMPDCLTLEEWVLSQSNLVIADQITLTYHLYEAAYALNFTTFGFEEFYPLAQVILSDFDQVDLALVDTDQLWKNTAALQNSAGPNKPPEVWMEMNESALKNRWVVNWNLLNQLYRSYNNRLAAKGLAGKGQVYRRVAAHLTGEGAFKYPLIHVIGFSSLTPSEVNILDFIKSKHPVLFYWNMPPKMLLPGLDAGHDVEKFSQYFGQDLLGNEALLPEVEIISASGILPQMKMISQLLESAEGEEETMAVLLPHPALIDIFLKSFPDSRSKVNVSLGYPLVYSPARSLLEWILEVWEDKEERSGQMDRSGIDKLWSHAYIVRFARQEKISLPDSRQLYFNTEQFDGNHKLLTLLFNSSPTTSTALERMNEILEELIPYQPDVFQREIMRYVIGRLSRLADVLARIPDLSYVFLRRILFEIFQTSSVPFRGEPMDGVQVLGVQEVQNLSFNTLIIPGMNEEVLPKGKLKSLIPFSLRRYYNLDDQSDQMGTQSYYIWSSILNARKVYLLSSNTDDLLGAKGMSRFLFQLKYAGLGIPTEEKYIDLELDGFEAEEKEIRMTEERQNQLSHYLRNRGISPSSLMTYIRCPFQFYLSYVLGIREDDAPSVGLDHRDMGTVIHEVMYALYKPFQGRTITGSDFEKLQKNVADLTREEYKKIYPLDTPEALSQSVHWMEQEIIIRAVNRFLEQDKKLVGLKIEILEEKLERRISTDQISDVRLSGKIDRLDSWKGHKRVIDYKTGISKLSSRGLKELIEKRSDTHNWQLLFYAYLLREKLEEGSFESGHYTLKDKKVYNPMRNGSNNLFTQSDLDEFETALQFFIDEMVNPEIPFRQTEKISVCEYCEFNAFCERQGILKS